MLKKDIDATRESALRNRLATQPYITDFEYILGAFIEMFEPHLAGIVRKLFKKGYALDASSGFNGKFAQYQSINGAFSIDFVTKNRLEKAGITQREFGGLKSLVFWPEHADMGYIKRQWFKIVDLLPDRGILISPINSFDAVEFRRKFVPKNLRLRQTRLFERLKHQIRSEVTNSVKKRIEKNPRPTTVESCLGVFVEELEPQVRKCILTLHKKGYSTDVSGFSNNPCSQIIEGDFQLDENIVTKLNSEGVTVEKTGSGYTKLQFIPTVADIDAIQNQWKTIVATIPDTHQEASYTMTRKARDFRATYT